MVSHRARPRDRSRKGWWIALGAVALLLLGGTFALGLLVGKHSSRQTAPVTAEPTRKSATAPRRSGLSEAHAERTAAHQEKLTFYQTLTAPLSPVSVPPKRDVAPKQEPAAVKPRAKPDSKPDPGPDRGHDRILRSDEPALPSRAVADPPKLDRPPTRPEREESSDKTDEWTVQVGVYKSAQQAERIRKELTDSGFPARLTSAAGDDGQPRYRVRVGAYRTRAEALKTAERLRSDRAVSTYVTAAK